jgi:transposase
MDALDAAPLCPSPRELRLESVTWATDEVVVVTAARRHVVACPVCGHSSRRVHSRYRRTLTDLPWHGLRVRLQLSVRKFFCDVPGCSRRVFTERLPTTAAPYARRTQRATDALRVIALALGGAGGARLAASLGLRASATTLLHSIRSAQLPTAGAPRAVGIDDWAWRKGLRYGTIVVDLERSCVLDLLPDRECDTVAAWLKAHPGVEIISRDRSDAFAEAGRRGAPNAMQVADRFHLVKNLGEAVQRVLSQHAALLRDVAEELAPPTSAAPVPTGGDLARGVPIKPLATAEFSASAESRARRLARYNEVMVLRASGATIQEIAAALKMSIGTVHGWIHNDGFPERARRRRSADSVLDAIRKRWSAGCHNAAAIWRALRAEGFEGSRRTVQREVARLAHEMGRCHREQSVPRARPPSPRHVAWLFGRDDAAGTDDDRRFITAVCARSPELATVRALAQRFLRIVHEHDSQRDAESRERAYDEWLAAARESELRGFARGLQSDDAAVRAALLTPWSNGPTEGHIHRLKLLKRTMYGRAKLDLLRFRMLAAG